MVQVNWIGWCKVAEAGAEYGVMKEVCERSSVGVLFEFLQTPLSKK